MTLFSKQLVFYNFFHPAFFPFFFFQHLGNILFASFVHSFFAAFSFIFPFSNSTLRRFSVSWGVFHCFFCFYKTSSTEKSETRGLSTTPFSLHDQKLFSLKRYKLSSFSPFFLLFFFYCYYHYMNYFSLF